MAHYNQNWDDLGQSIQMVVDKAISSQDFYKLEQTVRQVVDRAVDMGNQAVHKTVGAASEVGYQNRKRLYGRTFGKTVKGILKVVFGFQLAVFGFLGFLGTVFYSAPGVGDLVTAVFELAFLAGGIWLWYSGVSAFRMVKRFKVYQRVLGTGTHCTLESLARSVGKQESFVRKDLWRMFREGLFREGHMDKEETSLIISDETFRYYEHSRLQMEERQRQETAERQQKTSSSCDPQVQEVLDRGEAFIAQIRKCNDDIPGEEISEKIFRIEVLVQRIFDRAEAHPEIVPDLKKLMDYYLPMTVKLLNAYAEMDAQPVQGDTIQASKREIEAVLDTLNLAFEKLLDSIFLDTAMDVSSDISVLNTLLAQEGLTENAFSQAKGQQNR